ncbi:MAG: TfoX/Sxy family protein [Actinobacteria bacterium]|nr:hypothetical protein [Propionicimonas sp.]MBU3977979.1 TfoX/Sxy family protein [Actinomycetota bacterium]MBU3985423.1 TfoX/Sxy family protein [Actinomycetota bacterium]MBU4007518.1 TfoX/Sxy family protein [Actinomycetota bacterium]MBU4066588.1 TfoX/Sxy family protein [Actinomycetota bacterium]
MAGRRPAASLNHFHIDQRHADLSDELEQVVNVGPRLAAGLRQVGIPNLDELVDRGSIEAWELLRAAGL